MLAKELKIKTMAKQREFIEEQLSMVYTRGDGNVSYRYMGYIYPEVIKHFEDEGFDVARVQSDFLTAMAEGKPVYLFMPRNDIELSEEELKQAETYKEKKPEEFSYGDCSLEEVLRSIFE